jgi:hypothetical protein
MMTRDLGDGGWAAGCAGNPPPLHVYDTESRAANWYPCRRPYFRPTPPGPTMVRIPVVAPFGDDPTDPRSQTPGMERIPSTGMIARLNFKAVMGR